MTDRREPSAPPVLDPELVATLDELLAAADLVRMLGQAEEQLPVLAAALREAWARRDLPATRQAAHKLAGLAGSFGCAALMAFVQKAEVAARRDDAPSVAPVVDGLDAELTPALAALRGWRARLSA